MVLPVGSAEAALRVAWIAVSVDFQRISAPARGLPDSQPLVSKSRSAPFRGLRRFPQISVPLTGTESVAVEMHDPGRGRYRHERFRALYTSVRLITHQVAVNRPPNWSRRSDVVTRRQTPPRPDAVLKKVAFDLMTDPRLPLEIDQERDILFCFYNVLWIFRVRCSGLVPGTRVTGTVLARLPRAPDLRFAPSAVTRNGRAPVRTA